MTAQQPVINPEKALGLVARAIENCFINKAADTAAPVFASRSLVCDGKKMTSLSEGDLQKALRELEVTTSPNDLKTAKNKLNMVFPVSQITYGH